MSVDPGAAPRAGALAQLTLDLPHADQRTRSDFLPAAANRQALQAIDAWPAWPGPALLIEGPAASGKTHLARVFQAQAGAVWLEPAALWEAAGPLARLGRARAAVVDDADLVEDAPPLLHLYNHLAAAGGHLLLTAREPLSAWPLTLPDLRSRLRTAWLVRLDPPDDALLTALLVKLFADRQLRVEPEALGFAAARMERSCAGAARLVAALDRASLRAGRPIRAALVRQVLADLADTAPAETASEGRPWISG